MARQSGVSTPIFDELLREMTEGDQSPPPPAPTPGTPATPAQEPARGRRHRAD